MLQQLLNFFRKKPKKYSYTFDPASEGFNSLKKVDYKLKAIVDKTKNREGLSVEEVNYLISVAAPKNKPLEGVLYNFIPEIVGSMTLQLAGLEVHGFPGDDGAKSYLVLQDVSHGIELFAKVELKDFDEVFKPYVQPVIEPKDDEDAIN